ncbi:hypothetical protein GCM10010460_06900 [Microbacterium terrae]|nr:hypothetical protein GCM10017594_04480 [Microbacterium terrae]
MRSFRARQSSIRRTGYTCIAAALTAVHQNAPEWPAPRPAIARGLAGAKHRERAPPSWQEVPAARRLIVRVREDFCVGRLRMDASEAAVFVLFDVGVTNHERIREVNPGMAQDRFEGKAGHFATPRRLAL